MEALFGIVFLLGGALAVGRGLDLALWTDWTSGLCTVGSVWLRYAALGLAVGASVLIGYRLGRSPQELRSRCRPSGTVTLAAGVLFAAAGAARLLLALTGVGALIRAVLELACGVWCVMLGRSWLRSGAYRLPGQSMAPAVPCTAIFYWGVLSRFMENSSSWHRAGPTAVVWQMLAAVVFLAALVRTLWLPERANAGALCAAGLAAFQLCFCWELPRLLVQLFHGLTAALLPQTLFNAGLCCVGVLGAFSTARAARGDAAPAGPKHAVG